MFECERVGAVTVLTAHSGLDSHNASRAGHEVDELLGQRQVRLVLDLTQSDFVDSSGLGFIVSALRKCRDAGGSLALCGLNPKVRSLFALTCLDDVVPITVDRKAAVTICAS